jgi:Domain of unknown function (DUF4332)
MSTLLTIPGLGKSSLELLEAVGFQDENSLAKAGLDELVGELERANEVLKISKRPPRRADVEKWLIAARERVGFVEKESPDAPLVAVNYEGNPEVLAMLEKAPVALAMPARLLVDHQLAVGDIPPAVFLNRVVGDLDVRVSNEEPLRPARAAAVGSVFLNEASPPRREFDVSRVKSIADLEGVKSVRSAASSKDSGTDRVALIRAPRAETNRGRNPESRLYVRGVLHTHPGQMLLGAFVTLIMMIDLPLAVVSAVLLLVSDLKPESFSWVPKWLLVFPLSLPVVGLAFLILGVGAGKCRICGQRQFVPRACRKNIKAHHVPLIGYIVPTALHMLFFRWFRCTYCGTPVRLKE